MRRFTLSLVALFALTVCAIAQTLTTTDAVLVYYMPKTILAFDVTYTQTTRTQGPFYQYAERYLGTKDIVMADETVYELKDITVRTKTVADPDRAYKLTPSGNQKSNIILDKQGLLVAYNAEPEAQKEEKVFNSDSQPKGRKAESALAPLSEEALFASSKAKMAEAAAKQIYRIREMRLNLLAGEVDKAPADGEALQHMLQEMDRREQELTALFVGRRTVIHHKHLITYTPKSAAVKKEECILFRFSKYYGVVANDDLSGEPVKLKMSKTVHQLVTPDKPSKKADASLYYNLPGQGDLIITYGDRELVNHPIDVAQWGVSVPLSSTLMLDTPKITFCPLTGAIESIEK